MSGLEIAGLAVLGFGAGVFGTLVGIGGGVLFVPAFLLFFHFSPQHAIGTSLAAVFFNALSGSISYLRQGRVDLRSGWRFALATLPGALLGAWLVRYFTARLFALVFGIFLLVLALFVMVRPEPRKKPAGGEYTRRLVGSDGEVFSYHPRTGLGTILSFVVGIVSSLLGIGGGVIHVPALILLVGFPVHIATATSHFILAISAFFGAGTHLLLGNVLTLPAMVVAGAAVPGALIGARLSRRVKGRLIARLLSLALLIVGLRLLLQWLGIL